MPLERTVSAKQANKASRLSDLAISKAKPADKPRRLFDGNGLYLEVTPTGSRYWRLKYRIAGKEKRLALGVYPAVTLREARDKAQDARRTLQEGLDPSLKRRQAKAEQRLAAATTFGAVSRAWFEEWKVGRAAKSVEKTEWLLSLARVLDARPISEIDAREILEVVKPLHRSGRRESAHRLKQKISAVMRYGIAHGLLQSDPARDLRGALAAPITSNRAAVTDPKQVGELMRAIHGYSGHRLTEIALKLAPLLFVRPGNLRSMEWVELDLQRAEWRIPGDKMKMRDPHVAPLPTQAVELLHEAHTLSGRGRYVFPSIRSGSRPMSDNTLNAALRRMGFDKETMTAHGFRAMASSLLNEMGWAPDVIERALAHKERNKVKAAYNRATYLVERREMGQAWADYLDSLRLDAPVVPIGRRKRTAS